MPRNGVSNNNGNYLDHLVQRTTMPFDLVYADIGGPTADGSQAPLRISNAGKYITIAGSGDAHLDDTFIPQSNLLEVGAVEEDANFQIGELQLTLSGVNSAAISQLLGNPYLDRTVKIWRGLFDGEFNVVGTPVLMFDGRISGANLVDDPEAGTLTVQVTVASQWVDFERRNGNKTNDAEQQSRFPGDLGLQFAAESQRNIEWGRD